MTPYTRLALLGGTLTVGSVMSVEADAAPGSPFRIRLEGTQTDQGFPALKIHLARGGTDAGHIRVRFPEGIDATRAGDGEHLKFYQDVRSPAWPAKLECEPESLPVDWTGDADRVAYEMDLNNGMLLKATALVDGPSVVLSHDLANRTESNLASCVIWSCVMLAPSPPLADYLMERTGLPVDGRFQLFRELVPGFEPFAREQAEYQRFAGYIPGMISNTSNPRVVPHPGFPDDRTKDNHFWYAPDPIDVGAIATLSDDATWAVATAGKNVHSVWTNPGISCQHADPAGVPCGPGDTIHVTNAVHFIDGGANQLEAFLRNLTGD